VITHIEWYPIIYDILLCKFIKKNNYSNLKNFIESKLNNKATPAVVVERRTGDGSSRTGDGSSV